MTFQTHNLALCLAIGTLFSAYGTSEAQTGSPFLNPELPVAQRVADLVRRMTLEEKVGQMVNQAPAIPRLGIPAYNWWSEGLHGIARSGYATLFPQAIGMAATWDAPLIEAEGKVISVEARAKYNAASAEGNHARYFGLTIWTPNINIFRDPRWGRGQETYGGRPIPDRYPGHVVCARAAGHGRNVLPDHCDTEALRGAQRAGEHAPQGRHRAHAVDLESTYFPAFRATIVDAKADSLMCAYNAVNGLPACGNPALLTATLRKAWGFQGYVVSDCDAIDDFLHGHATSPDAEHAAATAVLAGTDMNCGDTYKALVKAVADKLLPESAIDEVVTRLFTARVRLGMFDPPASMPYASLPMSEDDSDAHRALALKAANEAMVLLKNDGTLPLRSGVKTIAVVGPNAASLLALEGNYNAIAPQPVLPVDGVRQQFAGARVIYAQGSPYAEGVELPVPRTVLRTASAARPD